MISHILVLNAGSSSVKFSVWSAGPDTPLSLTQRGAVTEHGGRVRFQVADNAGKQLAAEHIKTPPEDVLKRQLLERMISERLQLQLAAQLGVRVTDADVDQAIQSVARRNNMNTDALLKTLGREGFDPAAYRARIREQVTIQQLLEREIASRITVSDSEIANFLEQSRARGGDDHEYNLSHIFIPIPEAASSEQIQTAKERAERVHTELRGGEDFARAAVTYSQGPDALKGGALDWKKPGQLPELFVTALNRLQPGDISPVLRGPNGFHILKLNDRRGGEAGEAVTQTRVRHILLRPSTGYVSNTSVSPPYVVVGLFVAFAVFSFGFWGYFRFRSDPEAPADQVEGATGPVPVDVLVAEGVSAGEVHRGTVGTVETAVDRPVGRQAGQPEDGDPV